MRASSFRNDSDSLALMLVGPSETQYRREHVVTNDTRAHTVYFLKYNAAILTLGDFRLPGGFFDDDALDHIERTVDEKTFAIVRKRDITNKYLI